MNRIHGGTFIPLCLLAAVASCQRGNVATTRPVQTDNADQKKNEPSRASATTVGTEAAPLVIEGNGYTGVIFPPDRAEYGSRTQPFQGEFLRDFRAAAANKRAVETC